MSFKKIFQTENANTGISFLIVFLPTLAILYITSFLYLPFVELIYALIANFLLGLAGKSGSIVFQEHVWIVFEGLTIQISFLCTGLLEFFVIASAMLATFEKDLREKIAGIVFAGITVFTFNAIRIFVSGYLAFDSLEFADLAHNFFFKLTMFFLIVGIYYIWINYFTFGKKMLVKERN